jgi:hypothetical protein
MLFQTNMSCTFTLEYYYYYYYYYRFFLGKVILTHLVKKYIHLMDFTVSLPCSQMLTIT